MPRKRPTRTGKSFDIGGAEYRSDLKYAARFIREEARTYAKYGVGLEFDADLKNLRAVATRLQGYAKQDYCDGEARAALRCALGEAITRLEGLGFSSSCNEWRAIWRRT